MPRSSGTGAAGLFGGCNICVEAHARDRPRPPASGRSHGREPAARVERGVQARREAMHTPPQATHRSFARRKGIARAMASRARRRSPGTIPSRAARRNVRRMLISASPSASAPTSGGVMATATSSSSASGVSRIPAVDEAVTDACRLRKAPRRAVRRRSQRRRRERPPQGTEDFLVPDGRHLAEDTVDQNDRARPMLPHRRTTEPCSAGGK